MGSCAGWMWVWIATLSFMAGCGADKSEPQRAEPKLTRALPLNYSTECVPATDRELELFDLAASVIELTTNDELSSLDLGAHKFLSHPYRRGPIKDSVAVCIPDDVLMRVADALAARGGFGRGAITEHRLKLAGSLPRIDPWVIDSIGEVAFSKSFMPSEWLENNDVRPTARSVLAGFGALAKEYSQVAYEQMSADDSLGTGAAQVAAATGHPDALPRIVKLMDELLARTSEQETVPLQTHERFYELAVAIYFAGPAAKQHTAPIHKILRRKVEKWGLWYGMLEIEAKQYCDLLIAIEGQASIEPYPFCAGMKPTNYLLPRS